MTLKCSLVLSFYEQQLFMTLNCSSDVLGSSTKNEGKLPRIVSKSVPSFFKVLPFKQVSLCFTFRNKSFITGCHSTVNVRVMKCQSHVQQFMITCEQLVEIIDLAWSEAEYLVAIILLSCKQCGPVHNGQCEKVVNLEGSAKTRL